MRKFFTILFLFIVSIQFLPIKQMGKALFDNQFVEEEVHKCKIEKSKSLEPGKDLIFFDPAPHFVDIESQQFCLGTIALHTPPITDILAPPPNA